VHDVIQPHKNYFLRAQKTEAQKTLKFENDFTTDDLFLTQ